LGRGLGLGDAKLACCIGAALGPSDGLASLGIAFVLGGAYAGFLLVSRRGRRSDAVPFAPYLAFGTVLMSLYRSIA
jgi:leader peptidase (prepilin peptidase)/N-methyltransferase